MKANRPAPPREFTEDDLRHAARVVELELNHPAPVVAAHVEVPVEEPVVVSPMPTTTPADVATAVAHEREVFAESMDGTYVPLSRLFQKEERLSRTVTGRVRARTESIIRLSKREIERAGLLYRRDEWPPRPTTRGECTGTGAEASRPCPYVSCKYHLAIEVAPKNGAIKYNAPHLDVADMPETCALDVADRGGATLEEVARHLNITRERVRQIETKAIEHFRSVSTMSPELREYEQDMSREAKARAVENFARRTRPANDRDEWDELTGKLGLQEQDAAEDGALAEVTDAELARVEKALRKPPVNHGVRLTGAQLKQRVEELRAERGGSFGKPTEAHLARVNRRAEYLAHLDAEKAEVRGVTWPVLILTLHLHANTLAEQEAAAGCLEPLSTVPMGAYVRHCNTCGVLYMLRADGASSAHWKHCRPCRQSLVTADRLSVIEALQRELSPDLICSECKVRAVTRFKITKRTQKAWLSMCDLCRKTTGARTRSATGGLNELV